MKKAVQTIPGDHVVSSKTFVNLFVISASFTLSASPSHATEPPKVKHVIIVSIDGGKPDVLKASKMPNFEGLRNSGAFTWTASTIFPSLTLPSHTSMLTGVSPTKHGITWNEWKPEKGVVQVSTVFGVAKNAGFTTALFATKEKFRHLDVPGTLNDFNFVSTDAQGIAKLAADYFLVNQPNLMFVHFPDADRAGHSSGWGSSKQKKALTKVDSAVAMIGDVVQKSGLASDTVVIITADHGGTFLAHGTKSKSDSQIPWVAIGAGVIKGAKLGQIQTMDTSATALWLLGVTAPATWDGKAVSRAFQF